MNYHRIAAVLLAATLTAGALTACGDKNEPPVVNEPTTTTTAPTTTTTTVYVPPVYRVTASSVFIRATASFDAEGIGSLWQGDEVAVQALEGDWYRVLYDGRVGYLHSDYVALVSGTPVSGDNTVATTPTDSTEVITTTTTTVTAPTGSGQYTDRYIDSEGMLQFLPGDHYVQSGSYEAPATAPWNLLLVNDWNPMQKGYDEAVTMKKVETKYAQINANQQVDARMYDDLIKMLEAGRIYNIGVQSSYRPYATQNRLYWAQVGRWKDKYPNSIELQTKAGEVVKRPGFSEHNIGLAVDLYGSGDTSLSPSFANTPAYQWLIENCADYGFILRFPKGKEEITGVIYEAWHFRYVGDTTVAHAIMDNGLCLEEYLQQSGQ